MAILAWVKSRHAFLKLQEGTGDNLSEQDVANGMTDYVLWSTFCPECIDVDEELEMKHLDGGMMMFKARTSAIESLPECYVSAFDKPYDKTDVMILLHGEDDGV